MQEIGTRLRVTDLAQLGDAMLAVYDEAPPPDPIELLNGRLIQMHARVTQMDARLQVLEARTWSARWHRVVAWIQTWVRR